MASMAPHQQRVVTEREELVHKLDKLTEFLKGDLFRSLSTDEQERLQRQHRIMTEYSSVLAERINHF
jgi:glycerol-3-phosphate O-acyltransferase